MTELFNRRDAAKYIKGLRAFTLPRQPCERSYVREAKLHPDWQ